MKTSLSLLVTIASCLATAPLVLAAAPANKNPKAAQAALVAATQFDGTITAISDKAVIVKGATGEKTFAIHQGTVFGQGAKKKVSDFKAGDHVLVIFSIGGGQLKAENIRNPDADRKPAVKKPKAAAKP